MTADRSDPMRHSATEDPDFNQSGTPYMRCSGLRGQHPHLQQYRSLSGVAHIRQAPAVTVPAFFNILAASDAPSSVTFLSPSMKVQTL